MTTMGQVTGALDALVGAGKLVGYVVGVRSGGVSEVSAGGSRAVDGPAMPRDAVFPLASSTKPVAAVLAMRLVELGVLELDDPVAPHLPEIASPHVLTAPDAALDSTVPAVRPITLRHLLTMTAGCGWAPGTDALQEAMAAHSIAAGPFPPPLSPDEFMRRLGSLPLAAQPGDGWFYHTSSDVLGVLLSRVTGESVADLLTEHVLAPLGLTDTGFVVDGTRLPTPYGGADDRSIRETRLPDGFLTAAPRFASLSCGLGSTVPDYLRFLDVLAAGRPVLSRGSVIQMGTDALTPTQRSTAVGMIDPGSGYGFHVETRPDGSVGWAGGLGTIGYSNPLTGRSAALFTSQAVDTPGTEAAFEEFWQLLR